MSSNTIQFINEQIGSDELWKKEYARAGECHRLEQRIKHGLSLFRFFNSTDELWSQRVQSGSSQFDSEIVRVLHRAYSWWIEPASSILPQIAEFEKEGYKVDGAPELRCAYVTVRGILKTHIDEVIENFTKARAA